MEDDWNGFSYEHGGVKYYKHTCIGCGERWTDSWAINSYCNRNLKCRLRRMGK